MTSRQAVAFIRKHGVVLESAEGPVPSLAGTIAGAAIRGSWWGHPRSHEIFAATRAVRASQDVLVCRVVGGKITYVHRRLWAPLVRAASQFRLKNLARVQEVHTASGRHVVEEVPFPDWVPPDIVSEAAGLAEAEAARKLGSWAR